MTETSKTIERTASPAMLPTQIPTTVLKPSLDIKDIAPQILEQVNNSIKFGRSQSIGGVAGSNLPANSSSSTGTGVTPSQTDLVKTLQTIYAEN